MLRNFWFSLRVLSLVLMTAVFFSFMSGSARANTVVSHEQAAFGFATNALTVSSTSLSGGTDQFYVATVANYQNRPITSVSGLGLTWTKVIDQCGARSATGTQMWYAAGSPQTAGVVTATFGSTTQVANIVVTRYAGVDQVQPFVNAHGENTLGENGACVGGTDTRPATLTVSPTTAGSLVVTAVNARTRTVTSVPTGYLQRAYVQAGTSGALTQLYVYESAPSVFTPQLLSFNLSGISDWGTAGLVLQPAQSTPTPTPTPTPEPTPEPTPTPNPEPTPTPTPEPTPTPTPEPTPTPLPTPTPTPSPSVELKNEEVVTGFKTNATTVSSSSIQGGSEQFYLATIANYQNKDVSGVTGLGLSWTKVVEQCGARSATGTEVWYATGSPAAAGMVTATFASITQTANIIVTRYSGVNSTTPFANAHGENTLGENGACVGGTDSRPATITVAPTWLGSLVVVGVNGRTRAVTSVPGSYTQKAFVQSGNGGSVTQLYTFESKVVSAGTQQLSFNLSGVADWASTGLILLPQGEQPTPTPTPSPTPTPTPNPYPVLVGAGNIAKCSWLTDEKTADLLDNIPGTVFTLGDHAYEDGTLWDFNNCYNASWGRHKARTKPVVGNHDYQTNNAAGYFTYFGAAAGDPSKGYYSYDVGDWHVVVLNSNCSEVGGCGAGTAQDTWLKADLASNPKTCTAAMWHHASFSSSGNSLAMKNLWQVLYDNDADLVLTAHQHIYERFLPLTADGNVDMVRGLRQFVVGTGGANFADLDEPTPHSEVAHNQTHGVLKLSLKPAGYDWEFVPVAGQSFTDSGSAECH
jgi:hypothetical protein